MNLKKTLFNRTKNFIYSSELSDFNVYSKQFLNTIIKPYFSSSKGNYGSICIDFNKLNDINNHYGFNTGDKVIYYTIYLIKSVLPPNSTCARIGGDEFVFIIENCTFEDIQSYVQKIYDIIKENEKLLLFSTVTPYGIHSSEINNLSEMINYADLKITDLKNNYNKSSLSDWDILKEKLTTNLNSFFKSLRLYKTPISIDLLKQFYLHSISSCQNLLESDTSNNTINKGYINDNVSAKALDSSKISNCFTKPELEQFHHLFFEQNPSEKDISEIETANYTTLLEKLVRDPVTGCFTNEYFSKYLVPTNKFKVKYFSIPFVKLYNTIFSHEITDKQFQNITEKLIDYLKNEQHILFEKNCFADTSGNYFVSLGGGSYILALNENTDVNNSEINNYINSISNTVDSLEDIMTLICSKDFHCITSDNYKDVLKNLSCECKCLKDKYKLSVAKNTCIEDALSNIVYDSVKYYNENIPNSENIGQKTKFLNLLSQTMLDISNCLNKENNNFER